MLPRHADEISLSNLVSRSKRNLAQSATKCKSNYQVWTKVCRKEDMGIADNIALLVFGSRTYSARSAPKHTYQQ